MKTFPIDCLVLTATIDPRGCPGTTRTDPQTRLEDYCRAIAGWADQLAGTGTVVVIAENSGADATRLMDVLRYYWGNGELCALVQYQEPIELTHDGKSSGEARLIEHALVRAHEYFDADFSFVKSTGRLYVKQFSSCLPSSLGQFTGQVRPDMSAVDSRVFLSTWNTYQRYMWDIADEVCESDDLYFEMVLARRLHRVLSNGALRFTPFRTIPRIVGVSGSSGQPYSSVGPQFRRSFDDLVRRIFIRRQILL